MGNCFGCSVRSELVHLRAVVKRYESGSEYEKIQKEYRKQIAEMEDRLARSQRETQSMKVRYEEALKDYFSATEDLNKAELKIEMHDSILSEKDAEISRLKFLVSELEGKVQKLTGQINRDYTNSSIPSSKDENHRKISNSRLKTNRKPGGQIGHSQHSLKRHEPTEPPVMIPVPKEIETNPDYRRTGRIIRRQVIELDVQVKITEYCTPEFRRKSDGLKWHAPFPAGVSRDVNYGPGVKATAFLLNNYCNVSIDKVSEFMKQISCGTLNLSKGFISGLSEEFSDKTEEQRKYIYTVLQKAPCIYSDATVGRVNGENNAVIICATPNEALYCARDRKGITGLTGTPVEGFQSVIVHDHDKTYYNYGGAHQECLAHVLRYLQDSIENEPNLTWNSEMKEFLSSLIHKYKLQNGQIEEEQRVSYIAKYDKILAMAEDEYEKNPPSKYYRNGFNLFKRMKEYEDAHLLFLSHPEVGYTNNLSERNLRAYKRKQKQAVSFRSKASQMYFCDALSIIKTAQARGENIFSSAKNAFALSRG